MAEVTQPESPTPPAPEAPAASPLEQVYKDFPIEETASQFQPQSPQPAPTPAPVVGPKVPDPFDPNFPAYQQHVSQSVASLSQSLAQMQGKFTAFERGLAQKQAEADIKHAVGIITDKAGIEPEIAEVALEAKARSDPKFLQIWKNRQQNPKAYNAALQAVSSEFQQKFTVRQDPQLAENQRAVKAAQQQMATTQKQDPNDEWTSMSPAERQNKVRMLISRG